MTRTERFKKLFKFDHWAASLATESAASVPESNREDPRYHRLLELIAHNIIVKRVWLDRIEGVPPPEKVEFFPRWTPEECRENAVDVEERWGVFLAGMDESRLDHDVTYRSSEGVGYTSTIDDMLTHVVNHGTYHRGQVARLVHECGGRRASTDYIAFTRRNA